MIMSLGQDHSPSSSGTLPLFEDLPSYPAAQQGTASISSYSFNEDFPASSASSFMSEVPSETFRVVCENDRVYPTFGIHSYGLPIDEAEKNRLTLQHTKYRLLLDDRLFLAPIGPTPQRILDLGTGTGVWALDVADNFPSAEVIGVDIAHIQSAFVPPNCQFEIDDVEDLWTFQKDKFDFIHGRDLIFSIRNWPRLVAQCFRHLKPGGWCELAGAYPLPQCKDGTMPPDSGFPFVCALLMEAAAKFGTPLDAPTKFATFLSHAGFINISHEAFEVPASDWPMDPKLQEIGQLEERNWYDGASAFGLRVFEHAFGWSKTQSELELFKLRLDVKNHAYHQYTLHFVVYGQKPPVHRQFHDIGNT